MSTSNQQTLAELGAFERPPMLEKGSYVPWTSCFMRFMDNKQEEGERMRRLIEVGAQMTDSNKQRYLADIKVMNYLLQGIPNDIYNFVNACKTAKQM
ncbi:hypothetical protein Tco_0848564 [Tanacetum coccineum]